MLKNDVIIPSDSQLQEFITCFQFFETNDPIVIETIPNGHMDLTIMFDGHFSVSDLVDQKTIEVDNAHLFQITLRKLFLNFPIPCRGVNIKFKPVIKCIENVNLEDEDTSLLIEQIRSFGYKKSESVVTKLETTLNHFLNLKKIDSEIKKLINGIIYSEQTKKLQDIAEEFQIQLKQMTRLIKKHIGVSPKELRSLQRFYLAADQLRHSKMSSDISFSESIPLTYYDQSHFIKECRKITGLNPKRVFEMMKLDIADLLT